MIFGFPDICADFDGIDRIGMGARIANDVSIYRDGNLSGWISVGDGAVLHRSVRLAVGGRAHDVPSENASLVIGARSHVNVGAYLSGEGGLEIGEDVLIGPHARILSAGHEVDGGAPVIAHEPLTFGRIVIGDGAWVGGGATVLQGVTVGRGAVVGSGAVVTKDVPDFAIVVGVPAYVLRYRRGFAPESKPLRENEAILVAHDSIKWRLWLRRAVQQLKSRICSRGEKK